MRRVDDVALSRHLSSFLFSGILQCRLQYLSFLNDVIQASVVVFWSDNALVGLCV